MEQLRSDFRVLREQAIELRNIFNTFEYLFDSDADVGEVLTKSAAFFFHDLNKIMHEYLILFICRLTDPPKTGGKPNLTIPRMTDLLCKKEDIDPDVIPTIKALDKHIEDYRNLLKDARDKIVSHNDLHTYVSGSALGGHPKEKMIEFFDNIQEYFDLAGNAVGEGPADFSCSPESGDVEDLIQTLKRGLIEC